MNAGKTFIDTRLCRGCVYEMTWSNQHQYCNIYFETKGQKRPTLGENGKCVHYHQARRKPYHTRRGTENEP